MTTKSKAIELFGKEVILYVRTASDVINLEQQLKELDNSKRQDATYQLLVAAIILSDSLKRNLEKLKWYDIFKKKFIEKLTPEYLIDKLSPGEIVSLQISVYEIEGVLEAMTNTDNEKKSEQQ